MPFPSANAPTRTSMVFLVRLAVVVVVAVENEMSFEEVLELDVFAKEAAAVIVTGAAVFVIVTVAVLVGASVHSKLGTL